MQFFGLTIARTKSLSSLSSGFMSRAWWPVIRDFVTGAWQRNEEVRIDSALSNPTLFAVVTLIAGDIAKMRPRLMEQDDHGVWTEVRSESPFWPFLRKPNHFQTRIDFYEWWLLSKLVHGNTYALKARDARGIVRAAYVLDPWRVQVLLAPDGSVFYEIDANELAGVGASITVPAREIFHDVMCPLFHPLVGVSPIYAAGYPAMQGLNIRSASDRFFRNGSKPGGVLTAPGPIGQATADRLKTYWDENFSGDNTGKIAVLGDGLKYEAMAMTAEASKLVEQLRMTDEDICKTYHMPRHKVGVGPDPTHNNVEARNKDYYSDCLQKHIEKLELVLDEGCEYSNVSGRTMGVEFDRDALFEMDTTAQSEAAAKAIGSGMSPDEVRYRFFGLGPVPGGKSPMVQQQYYSLEALAKRDALPDPFHSTRALPAPPKPIDEPQSQKSLTKQDATDALRKALAA